MQSESDSAREQRFYRLELRARRDQKTTKISEKLFSLIYATVANYGASIGRPFVTLALMIAVFAAGYWAWGYSIGAVQPLAVAVSQRTGPPVTGTAKATAPVADGVPIDPVDAVWSALEFSWGNVFQPLSAPSTENDYLDRNTLASRLLYADGGEVDMKGFFVRVAATFQSLFAIVLAFLVALAVRRKFQIA